MLGLLITVVGALFCVLYAVTTFAGPRWLLGALAAAIPFTHVAALTVAGNAVNPFWLGTVFVAARLGWYFWRGDGVRVLRRVRLSGATFALALFAAYAVVATVIGAGLFAGTGVYTPRGGIDEQLGALTPLTYTVSTWAQIGYLVLGLLVVAWVSLEVSAPTRVFEIVICVGLLLTLWRALLPDVWPTAVFDSIPSYSYMNWEGARERGPFAEPSVLAMFLIASLAYAASAFSRAPLWGRLYYGTIILVAAYLATLSTTGTALAAGACLALVATALFVWRAVASRRLRLLLWAGGVAVALGLLIAASWRVIAPFTVDVVLEKLGSDSMTNRTASDVRAWGVFLESWGVGVGLGANRPSSFLFMLLSSVGLIGLLLFVRTFVGFALVGLASPAARATSWALVATLVAQSVAVPDLSMPQLWLLIACAAAAYCRFQRGIADEPSHAWASLVTQIPKEYGLFRAGYLHTAPRRRR